MKFSLLVILFSSFAAHSASMTPGLWHAETKVDVEGIPLPSSSDKECITEEQASDIRKTIASELSRHGCKITKWNLANEKLKASLTCDNGKMDASGDLTGTVKSKSYNLAGKAAGSYMQLPATANLSLKGNWISNCEN